MRPAIAGIGVWYPEEVRKNDAWPKKLAHQSAIAEDRTFNDIPRALGDAAEITQRYLEIEANDPFLGVLERRVAAEHISAVDAETDAAKMAVEDAGIDPSEIDAVISYSNVPDRISPASAGSVAYRLGIQGAMTWGLEMACASSVAQMATAVGLVASGQARNVLLTQSHLTLRTCPLIHPAAPGIGDAASALVIGKEGRWPILRTHIVTHGEYDRAVTWIRGPQDRSDPPWYKAGGDFRVGTREREGAKVLQRDTVSFGVKTLREIVGKQGIDMARIGLLASVEPRGWIPRAIAQVLGLDPEITSSVYELRGHLGACGPIANLYKAYRDQRMSEVDVAAIYAQGAGYTRAAVLLQIDL